MKDETDERPGLDRRTFLKGAATGAASVAVGGSTLAAQSAAAPDLGSNRASAPTADQLARDSGTGRPPSAAQATAHRPGSDLIVETLKQLGIEFVAANPGSSFEGLQESLVNYGSPPNFMPEFITALHEETAVDMANGYAKAEGRPMCALLHGTIGLQHGAMAIYQAYCAGTPLLLIAGRDDGFIQAHTANDMAAIVRSFTKWDAHPTTLAGCLSDLQEAYRQAVTPPTGPTLVVIDTEIQKQEAGTLSVPRYVHPDMSHLGRDGAQLIAARLLAASHPRILVGQLRTPEGVRRAIELAELAGASTMTAATTGPMSFPQRHALCGPGASSAYDFTLGLEVASGDIALVGPRIDAVAAARDRAGIGFGGLRTEHARENPFPGAAQKAPATLMGVDAEASLPNIIAALRELRTHSHEQAIAARTALYAEANREARLAQLRKAVDEKRVGWDASPVSTARLYAQLWPLIAEEDWCLASPSAFSGAHHQALWMHDRPYSYLGPQGAGGMGYGAGACAGAALAARSRKRIVINIQTDGDLNYAPGVLWSAAHHHLPVLTIMHNNRAWHQELMFLEFMAGVRGRGTDRAHIGSTLRNPFIDYKKMAEAYGMAGEGPIEDPNLLQAALQRGVDSVKRGEPYLIDVVTQPR